MNINEEDYPHIVELIDTNLHNEIVDKVKTYLRDYECLNKGEILEKIDVCYDENNIPSTINMSTIVLIVENINDFENYLDEQFALANLDKFKELNESLKANKFGKSK